MSTTPYIMSTRVYRFLVTFAFPVLPLSALHAQDRPLAWDDVAEVWRAGGLGAPQWAQFTRPDGMDFDGDGNLYVVDGEAGHIVKVGPDGRLVMTIGRPGEGPGEFKSLYDVLVWPDGSFVANDGGRDVFHVFGADGNFQRMVRWRAETGTISLDFNSSRPMRPGPHPEVIYAQGTESGLTRMYGALAERVGAESGDEVDERTIEALGLAGDLVSGEILLETWRPPRPETPAEVEVGNTESMFNSLTEAPHFEPELRWDALPDGAIVYADSTTYRVRIVRDGATLNTLTRAIAPQPVTSAIESRVRETMLRELDEDDEEPAREVPGVSGIDFAAIDREIEAAARKRIGDMKFYPEIPVIAQIRAAPDGSVWVLRQDAVNEDDDGLIDVFDPEGGYRGTFPADGPGMPDAFGPDGLVAYWELDELEVPSVVVRRVAAGLR